MYLNLKSRNHEKILNKSVLVILVFIATNAFISCDWFPSKKETLIAAANNIIVLKKNKKSPIKNQSFLLQVLTKELKPFIPTLALILNKRNCM
jgi:predicted FMN-binding regulatory protein PaiB